MTDWSRAAFRSAKGMVRRVLRTGLSPNRVDKHQKRGHDVSYLSDMCPPQPRADRPLCGRGANWSYSIVAAASGAGAGLIIPEAELLGVAGAGSAAAPSAGTIAGTLVGDAAVVLGLASCSVGQVSLLY